MNRRQTKELCDEIEDDLLILQFQVSQNELQRLPKKNRENFEKLLNHDIQRINDRESKKKAQKRVTRLKGILKNRF